MIRAVITETYSSWRADRTIRLGAGLAYYGLFAVVPVLSISLAGAGIVLHDANVEESLANVLGDIVQGDAAEVSAAIGRSLDDFTVAGGSG